MWETRLRVTSNGMRVTEQYAPSWARLAPKPFRRIGRTNGYDGEFFFMALEYLKSDQFVHVLTRIVKLAFLVEVNVCQYLSGTN